MTVICVTVVKLWVWSKRPECWYGDRVHAAPAPTYTYVTRKLVSHVTQSTELMLASVKQSNCELQIFSVRRTSLVPVEKIMGGLGTRPETHHDPSNFSPGLSA